MGDLMLKNLLLLVRIFSINHLQQKTRQTPMVHRNPLDLRPDNLAQNCIAVNLWTLNLLTKITFQVEVQKTMPKIVLDFLRLIIIAAATIMGPSQTRRSALNCGKVQGNALKLSKGSLKNHHQPTLNNNNSLI